MLRNDLLVSNKCHALGSPPRLVSVILTDKLVSWDAPLANKKVIRAELFDKQSNK